MMDSTGLDAQAAARVAVGALAVQSQSDAPGLEATIERAMREAIDNDWIDVRLALLHVQNLYFEMRDPARVGPLIDTLLREARQSGLRAMEAIGLLDQISLSNATGTLEPLQTYATIRVLLSDRSQPALDRVSGLINLALQLDVIGLGELADETLVDAAAVAGELRDGREPLAVIANNRAMMLLRRSANAILLGDLPRARQLFDRHAPLAAEVDVEHIPDTWTTRLRAFERVIGALFADSDLDCGEAAELTGAMADVDAGIGLVVGLTTARDAWPESVEAEVETIEGDYAVLARYLHVRACRRAGNRPEELVEALDRFNAVLSLRADRIRKELEAGVTAMISSELLSAERAELVTQAMTDPLTGLANRRSFQDRLDRYVDRPGTLVLIDLDDFKAVNDTYGHEAGDGVLIGMSEALLDAARRFEPESVARIGGDEFAVLLAGEQVGIAEQLTEAFRRAVRQRDWTPVQSPTAAVGIASGSCGSELFRAADLDLYEQKRVHNR